LKPLAYLVELGGPAVKTVTLSEAMAYRGLESTKVTPLVALEDAEAAIQAARQERGEAVAWTEQDALAALHFESDGSFGQDDVDQMLSLMRHIEMMRGEKVAAHPTPDAGRVAEPDRLAHRYNRELVSRLQSFLDRLANDDYAGTKFEADGDALRDALTFVRDAERALLNWQYEYGELEKGHRHYKSKADGLEAQLAASMAVAPSAEKEQTK